MWIDSIFSLIIWEPKTDAKKSIKLELLSLSPRVAQALKSLGWNLQNRTPAQLECFPDLSRQLAFEGQFPPLFRHPLAFFFFFLFILVII